MGRSCSKSENQAELENRRIQREIRLGLIPQPHWPSVRPSMQLSRPTLSTRSGPVNCRNQIGCSPQTFKPQTPYAQAEGNSRNSVSLSPCGLPQNDRTVTSSFYPRFIPGRPPSSPRRPMVPNSNHHPPRLKGRLVANDSTRSHEKLKDSKDGGSKLRVNKFHASDNEKPKSKINPVLRQALNLLSVEELRSRSKLLSEAALQFMNLERQFRSHIKLEYIRAAVFELFRLQAKSREAVCEQERNERKLLVFWMNQTFEEERLKELIEATQGRQESSTLASYDAFYSSPKRIGTRDTSVKNAIVPIEALPLNKAKKNKRNFSKEILVEKAVDYSPPDPVQISSLDERGVFNENLDRKIRRQTRMIREVVPLFTPKTVAIAADSTSNYHSTNQEYDELRSTPPKRLPPPPIPDFQKDYGESSSLRSLYSDPFRTPRGKSFAELKGESDLAMKRRLAALLMA